ncbi:MAG: hypothetical protein HY727_08480 [Candidatus Rokubacteria bacterium]|nr:hypothetical protein [Candidatus Rokubacteria bacterium]
MDPGHARRLLGWLDDDTIRAVDPEAVARLRGALERPSGTSDLVTRAAHGTSICFRPGEGEHPGRRLLELDRHGTLVAALRWSRGGALLRAWVRIPDGSWLAIEPDATPDAPWGRSDRLWHHDRPDTTAAAPSGTPLTVFAALDWARVDAIPPLAEPARLPPGGGTAVLNLIASLALDQGRQRLSYRGPYPTEQLFLALLESFRYDADAAEPLGAFMGGGLDWRPAPHERLFTREGLYVQLRAGVEKVVWRGRTYYRPEWQGVRRYAPRRVRDTPDATVCSLWALERPVEDHLWLAADGEPLRLGAPAPEASPVRSLSAAVRDGVIAVVIATSAPPLADSIRAVAPALALEWGPVDGDLISIAPTRARLSTRLRATIRARLRDAGAPEARLRVGLAALTEIAALLGDELRARAQRRLAALDPASQAQALAVIAPPAASGERDARTISHAVEGLVGDPRSSGGPDDHQDVEGDEGGHRER